MSLCVGWMLLYLARTLSRGLHRKRYAKNVALFCIPQYYLKKNYVSSKLWHDKLESDPNFNLYLKESEI